MSEVADKSNSIRSDLKEVVLVIQHAGDDDCEWDAAQYPEKPPDPYVCLRIDWKRRAHDVRLVSTLGLRATSLIDGASVWTLKPIARVVGPVVTGDDDYTIVVAPFVAIVLSEDHNWSTRAT